jgi:restriction endonuclease S subunit
MTSFDEIRLGDLADVLSITKGFPTQRASSEGEVRVMSLADLRNENPPRYFANRKTIGDVGLTTAKPADVLVAVEGGTVGETLVVPDGIDEFVPSQQVATLRVLDNTRLDPWYLGAWLTTEPAREQLRRLARGMAIQRIPVKDLASLTVSVPTLSDQREIGRRYLAFETAIQSHRAITSCLEDLRDLDLVVTFAGCNLDRSNAESPKARKVAAHGL